MGTATDFPDLHSEKQFNLGSPAQREAYLLKTHSAGLYIIGASDLGVQHAVWEFLYKLGYRQFFPTETWEVAPEKKTLKVSLDLYESPSFLLLLRDLILPSNDLIQPISCPILNAVVDFLLASMFWNKPLEKFLRLY